MRSDDYLKRITNYIFDSRYSRALLIDGDWGCGKSYFVKKRLIPELEQKETNQDAKDNTTPYLPLLVSLYGLSSIDSIQELIYSTLLEKYVSREKDGKLHSLLKNTSLFGTKIIKVAADFFNVDESVKAFVLVCVFEPHRFIITALGKACCPKCFLKQRLYILFQIIRSSINNLLMICTVKNRQQGISDSGIND